MDKETPVSQQDSFSPGQSRVNLGVEVHDGKQNVYAPDCVCPVCRDSGRLWVDVPYGGPLFGKSTPCACMKDRLKILRRREPCQAANIDALRDYTFKTFNVRVPGVQETVRISLDHAIRPQGWLLLPGSCGCGKTHLAAVIANQRLESVGTVFFTTALDLLDTLRAALVSPEHYSQLYSWIPEAELFILDELGAQQHSAWSNEKLLQILDYCATVTLPTILTAVPKEFLGLAERFRSLLSIAQPVTPVIFEKVKDFRPSKRASRRRT
jgi:chromosomal replication initiation ATPase DnaA